MAWERRNSARILWQLLSVEVIYRWILLHECWDRWTNPCRDLWEISPMHPAGLRDADGGELVGHLVV